MPGRCDSLSLLLVLGVLGAARIVGAEAVENRIWMEMDGEVSQATVADLSAAIRLRLPGWTVEPRPENSAVSGVWLVRLRSDSAGIALDVIDPAGRPVVTGEGLPGEAGGMEQARHGAVVVALAVQMRREAPRTVAIAEEIPAGATPMPAATRPKEEAGKQDASPTIVEAGLAPGITIGTGKGDVVFGVAVGARAFVAGDLAFEGGARISMNWEGGARDERVLVGDRAFWLGPAYRLRPAKTVGIDLGAAFQYTWPVTDIPTDSRYAVVEKSPAARFSPRVFARGAWRFVDHVAAALTVAAIPTFSERTYMVRGVDAVDLGYATVDVLIGVDACF